MWDLLKQVDIACAKELIARRRAAALDRHVQELRSLEADRAELERLYRLADAFTQRFKKAVSPAPAPEPAAPVATDHEGGIRKPVVVARQPDRPDWSRTNFDQFAQAVAKAL